MKKVVFVVVLLAVISTVLASYEDHVEGPGPNEGPAPEPTSGDATSLSSFLGASLLSFVAYFYLQFSA